MSSHPYDASPTRLRRPPLSPPEYQPSPLNPDRPAVSSRSPRTPMYAAPVARELFLEYDNIRFPDSDPVIPMGVRLVSPAEDLHFRMEAYTRRISANNFYGWRSPPSPLDQSPRTPNLSSTSPSSPEDSRTYVDPPLPPNTPRPLPSFLERLPESASATKKIPRVSPPFWQMPSMGEVIDGTLFRPKSAPPTDLVQSQSSPGSPRAAPFPGSPGVQDAQRYRATIRTLVGKFGDLTQKNTGLAKEKMELQRRMRSMNRVSISALE